MKDALSIPVLEDNDNDVELVRRCLSQEIPGVVRVVVQDGRPKALFGVVIKVSEPRRAEASLEGQVSVVFRETCISREGWRICLPEHPGACCAADRNCSGQTFRSTNYYVKLRSQNTQAREWRLDLEKGKRTLMYARRQPSSRAIAPGRSGKKRAASLNLSRGTPGLRHSELVSAP
jgi:hypothetical protein